MQVVRVSGTIKKVEEEAIRRARLSIRRAQKTPSVTTPVQAASMNEEEDVLGFADGIEDVDEDGDMDEDSLSAASTE